MSEQELSKLMNELFTLAPIMHQNIIRPIETNNTLQLTPMQIHALLILHFKESLNMTSLAKELMICKQQLTKIVEGLVSSNYVERYQEANNRRTIYVRLSKKGKKIIEELQAAIIQRQISTFQRLNEEERIELLNAIQTIKKVLENQAQKEIYL